MSEWYIERQKEFYKRLKPIYCPVLQEMVYFNSKGFKHLLYSRHKGPRSNSERKYRFSLLPYVEEVISRSDKAIKMIKSKKPIVVTWALSHEVNLKNVRQSEVKVIVIRNKPDGRLYFLSVMDK